MTQLNAPSRTYPVPRVLKTPPAPIAPVPDYVMTVVRDEAGLRQHVPAWDDLARHAAEPNAFYESWNLLPALRSFAAGVDLRFVLVYQPVNAQRPRPVLCGFFPLMRRTLYRRLPVTVLESWRHLFCFVTTPLLRGGHASEVLNILFDWMANDPDGAPIWRMEVAPRDGAFGQALVDVCYHRARPTFTIDTYGRAFLMMRENAETYLEGILPTRRRKDYRRKARLLADKGHLERRVLAPDGDVGAWTEDFLQLEASGWKGSECTAMLSEAVHADYFRTMTRAAFDRGQLQMLGLFLDGRPIAMKCNLLSGEGSFAFKIGMDETHLTCSPGALLELFNIEHLHTTRAARWMDSCASPDHPMIDRLWSDRRVVQTHLIATGGRSGDLAVSLMPLGRWLRCFLRWSSCPKTPTARVKPMVVSMPAETGAVAESPSRDLLTIDQTPFDDCFGRRPFVIGHQLAEHALFAVPRLLELARFLPEDRVEYNAGNLPVSIDPALTPRTGLSPEETIARIAECRSWLVLKNVERDPQYADLLDRCLAEVARRGHPDTQKIDLREAFIFISSPDAVTPFHIDPEWNFLLQVRGQKIIHVFPSEDRSLVGEEELERFYSGAHRNLVFKDAFQAKAETFILKPGDGVHVPVTAPHWVQNGPEVSISFSITFQTRGSERRGIIYRVNRWLRQRGLTPTPVGQSGWRDRTKYLAYRVLRRLRRMLGSKDAL